MYTGIGQFKRIPCYSERKIAESLGNVTVRGEKYVKSKGGARWQQYVWACIA
jgi:hypothetical protein